MRRGAVAILAVLSAAAATGCQTTGSGRWVDGWWVRTVRVSTPRGEHDVPVRYRAGLVGDGWTEGPAPPGDFSFYSRGLGATLYADSSCGRAYDDAPLPILSRHLTMGFEQVHVEQENELLLSGRAGLELLASATLDGVPVRLATSVTKKGACVFDLVLIARPDRFEPALADYRRFRDGFDAEVGP